MSNRRTTWTEALGDVLASWGLSPRAATARAQAARVQVWGPTHDDERVLVGELTNEVGEYVFRYAPAYAARSDYPALAAFPNKQRDYRSRDLWPFFDVRLPPLDRADIRNLIRERKIDEGDTLRLLAELGRRTVTTPYELQYGAAGSR